jgi:ketosteroid isomerase-like protein
MERGQIPDLVRRLFGAYQSKDRKVMEELLSDDFTFTSPYDYHIDRTAYFERCWPNSDRIRMHHLERIVQDGDEAFVLYDCETVSGDRFRNTERTSSEAAPQAQVRALIEKRVAAVRAKDVDDMVMFDVVEPLQRDGAEGARERAKAWFSSFEGPIGYEMRDLVVAASGDVAFSHSLNCYSGATTTGGRIDMWVRATSCYRKVDGERRVTHEHSSVPFDPQTRLASLGLKP